MCLSLFKCSSRQKSKNSKNPNSLLLPFTTHPSLTQRVPTHQNPNDKIQLLSQIEKKITINPKSHRFNCKNCSNSKICLKESPPTHPSPPIKGLDCDWITSNILTSQRPSTLLIRKHNIGKQLKENCIYSVFCLQEPGEHPNCGPGILDSTGFSYSPKNFCLEDFEPDFYNFGWKDQYCNDIDF